MKRVFVIIFLLPVLAFGQIPPNYYFSAAGKQGPFLLNALHNIIKGHIPVLSTNIHTIMERTDAKPNGKVWDLYGYVPSGPQNYEYTFGTMACGVFAIESDCYDLEYVWPKAWFNDQSIPSVDLFNIYPADAFVQSKRALLPYGTAFTASYTSLNWSKVGACGDNGYTGTIFEPNNDMKGDIARAYFYMSTRYYAEDGFWGSSAATNKSTILPWQMSVLLSWNQYDPVSAKELARNDTIYYKYQANRNPFIDHPQFADSIWTAYISVNELADVKENYSVFPNPATQGQTHLAGVHRGDKIEVFNTIGQTVFSDESRSEFMDLDLSTLPHGIYTLTIRTKFKVHSYKLVNAP
jgi:endonuclease I